MFESAKTHSAHILALVASATPTIVCAPRIVRVFAPLALQVRRQGTPRATGKQVPPEVEQQPFQIRVANVGLVGGTQLVSRCAKVGLLANVELKPPHQLRVIRDMCCEDDGVSRWGRRGRADACDERVVRVGTLEGEAVRRVSGIRVVVRAADPGDPGFARVGDTDRRVLCTCWSARDGGIGTTRRDPGEDLERHTRAGGRSDDFERGVVEAGDGRSGEPRFSIDGVCVGKVWEGA